MFWCLHSVWKPKQEIALKNCNFFFRVCSCTDQSGLSSGRPHPAPSIKSTDISWEKHIALGTFNQCWASSPQFQGFSSKFSPGQLSTQCRTVGAEVITKQSMQYVLRYQKITRWTAGYLHGWCIVCCKVRFLKGACGLFMKPLGWMC